MQTHLAFLAFILFHSHFLYSSDEFSLNQVEKIFPSKGYENQIAFWKKVFTEYSSNEVIFHDQSDLRLIYHRVDYGQGVEGKPEEAQRQRKLLKKEAKWLKAAFDQIRRLGIDSKELDPIHRKIIEVLEENGYNITDSLLLQLRENVRYQRGVRDKFEASLIRSGLYLDQIRDTFEKYGLPTELAAMPHVESSFNYNAYSSAGAAGIWQFTRGTGRYYMRIDRYVDERLDPIKATDAAARLLSENFQALGNWPLALTSYNHGRNGMLRAKKQHGPDLRIIIQKYQSRYFGFASKNFYSEFLAALEVSKNYLKYFGDLEISKRFEFDSILLDRSYDISHFRSVPNLDEDVLRDYNPHLRNIWNSRYRIIPAGIEFRVPIGAKDLLLSALESAKPSSEKLMVSDDGSTRYRVQNGDTLSWIASNLGTTVRNLQELNRIRNPNHIYPGQILLISIGSGEFPITRLEPGESETYTIREGDSLGLIARRFGTSIEEICTSNGISNPNRIYPGMKLSIQGASSGTPKRYKVQPGDTLGKIAQRFGKSIHQIKDVNGIQNANQIRQGQELLIP